LPIRLPLNKYVNSLAEGCAVSRNSKDGHSLVEFLPFGERVSGSEAAAPTPPGRLYSIIQSQQWVAFASTEFVGVGGSS